MSRTICHSYLYPAYSNRETTAVPDCNIPPSPGENGQVDYNATTYLSQANYSCDLGNVLVGGNDTRVCLLSGIWSGEVPVCQGKYP